MISPYTPKPLTNGMKTRGLPGMFAPQAPGVRPGHQGRGRPLGAFGDPGRRHVGTGFQRGGSAPVDEPDRLGRPRAVPSAAPYRPVPTGCPGRRAACSASTGVAAWIPEEPVPITPTRCPVGSTPSSGRAEVCSRPAKVARPSIAGVAVPVSDPAHAGGGLEHSHREVPATEPVQRVQPGDTRADDRHIDSGPAR